MACHANFYLKMWLHYPIEGANGEANHDAKNHDFEAGFLYDFHAAEQRDRGFDRET